MQYDLAEFALKMVAPNNKLIYDDKGIPSVMVYIRKFLCRAPKVPQW